MALLVWPLMSDNDQEELLPGSPTFVTMRVRGSIARTCRSLAHHRRPHTDPVWRSLTGGWKVAPEQGNRISTMTGHCHDLPGPKDQLVVATSASWVPFDETAAKRVAESAMLLACSPEHVERLRQESQAPASSSA
jgi:hypothetical protein